MQVRRAELLLCGLIAACCVAGGCGRKAAKPVETAAGAPAETEAPKATGTAAVLLAPKSSDDDYLQAIAALESADVAADVERAMKSGDHRLFGIQAEVFEAPGVEGDRRTLPKGAYVVAVGGTSASQGSKHQQRFQMLARLYAGKYNPALLSKLR